MVVSTTNRLALVCSLALAIRCAGGEEVAGQSGGAAGTASPPWASTGGSTAAAGGSAPQPGGGGATGGYGGTSGSTSVGSGGAGTGGIGTAGTGGATYVSPIGTGGTGGGVAGDATRAGSGGAPPIDAGSGCGMAGTETAPVTAGGITVRYRNQDGGAKGSAIQFDLEIATSNAAGIALSDVEIRYYFTNEVGDLVNEMYWAGTSSDALTSAVTTKIVPIAAVAGANTYASYTLPATAAKIAPGNALTIKPAHHKAGYAAAFNQCDDYSYGVVRDFVAFTRVAVFVKGALAWGSVPGQTIAVEASAPDAQSPDAALEAQAGDAPSGDASDDAAASDAPIE
jgi:hypothetical protein